MRNSYLALRLQISEKLELAGIDVLGFESFDITNLVHDEEQNTKKQEIGLGRIKSSVHLQRTEC